MKIIRREAKTTTVNRRGSPASTTYFRRFIRDARPAAPCYGSGAFWYPIWRNIRKA